MEGCWGHQGKSLKGAWCWVCSLTHNADPRVLVEGTVLTFVLMRGLWGLEADVILTHSADLRPCGLSVRVLG